MDPSGSVITAMVALPAFLMARLTLAAVAAAIIIGVCGGIRDRGADPDAGTWPAIVYGLCLVIAAAAWPITGRWWYLPAMIIAMPAARRLTRAARPVWRPVARAMAAAVRATGRAGARTGGAATAGARAALHPAVRGLGAAARQARLVATRGAGTAGRSMRHAAFVTWPLVRGAAALAGTALSCALVWAAGGAARSCRTGLGRIRVWARQDGDAWRRRYEWLHS